MMRESRRRCEQQPQDYNASRFLSAFLSLSGRKQVYTFWLCGANVLFRQSSTQRFLQSCRFDRNLLNFTVLCNSQETAARTVPTVTWLLLLLAPQFAIAEIPAGIVISNSGAPIRKDKFSSCAYRPGGRITFFRRRYFDRRRWGQSGLVCSKDQIHIAGGRRV